jgi:macrolide-specific efflux system membrane fusion protein
MKKIVSFLSALIYRLITLPVKAKVIIIVLAVIAGWLLYTRISKNNSKTQYQTATVTRGSIIESITESGNITSSNETNIGSPTNGVISEIYVRNGDEVSPGENLFKVRSTATPQEQAAAYASYLSSQNNLNATTAKMNSLQSALFKANQTFINDRGIPNPSDEQKTDPKYIEENADWLQAQADYNNQKGVIAAAQASFTSASLTYAATQDSVVTAPIEGTVANFSLGLGSNVTASGTTYNNSTSANSSNAATGTPVLVLGNFSNLSIKAPINEVDIAKVRSGQKATITLDAYPDMTYVGRVDSIDTIGTNTSGVVTFNAYIAFVAPPATIHPGMSASAIVQLSRHDDVLSVPTSAIQSTADGQYVRVMKNGIVSQVPVETGLSSDTDTEITSGLAEGQTVVTSVITPTTSSSSTSTSPFGGLGGNRGFGGGGFGGSTTRTVGAGAVRAGTGR